jgi:hypothetical protein
MASAHAAPRQSNVVLAVPTHHKAGERHFIGLARRAGAFILWWLAMSAIVVAAFALGFALCLIV